MGAVQRDLSSTFQQFFNSEKSSGILLIICTVTSLVVANSASGPAYASLWQTYVGGLTIEHWVNDALMAIFFLFVGLELEHEIYSGELSQLKKALLPIFAAVGGILTPALLHFSLNAQTPTQAGVGIPMATDIAFALGILAVLGSRVPAALRVFVVAFAVIDDLFAILVIALFYTAELSPHYLIAALTVWMLLFALNRIFRLMSLAVYLLAGAVMWLFMLKSGVHATVAGVMLAFAIPYSAKADDEDPPSRRLEHILRIPVAFIILPIFALANTVIVIGADWAQNLSSPNSVGIIAGLVLGKPLGVSLLSLAAVKIGLCRLPPELHWRHIVGAGILGGIGFTMSIFIANLAFVGSAASVNASKMAIVVASLASGTLGFVWLRLVSKADVTA